MDASVKNVMCDAADSLTGYAKRLFMARTVLQAFEGVIYRAERELGWNRRTIKLGLNELRSGIECCDGRRGTVGRKPAEMRLPNLLSDISSIVEEQCQTDPTFRSARLYTRLSVAEVRRQLIVQKGYRDDELPCEETIRVKCNQLGFHPARVAKTKPKKSPPDRRHLRADEAGA
jgi:hypothetical protein